MTLKIYGNSLIKVKYGVADDMTCFVHYGDDDGYSDTWSVLVPLAWGCYLIYEIHHKLVNRYVSIASAASSLGLNLSASISSLRVSFSFEPNKKTTFNPNKDFCVHSCCLHDLSTSFLSRFYFVRSRLSPLTSWFLSFELYLFHSNKNYACYNHIILSLAMQSVY